MSAEIVLDQVNDGKFARLREKLASVKNNPSIGDAALVFTVRILAAVLAFGVQIFLARSLDIAQYGVYVTLWTWLIVMSHLAVFGFSEASLRFLPRYIRRKHHGWLKGFLITGYKTVILSSSILGVLGAGFLYAIAGHIDDIYLIPLFILLFGLPFFTLELYLEGVSRSFGWFLLTMLPGYVIRPFVIAAMVAGGYGLGFSVDAGFVLAVATAVTALSVIGQSLIIRRRMINVSHDAPRLEPKKLWIAACLPLTLLLLIDEIFLWSDILIISFLSEPENISIYFAAQKSMSLAAFVQFAFMMVVARDFAISTGNINKAELQEKVSKSSIWTFWLTVPAVLLTLAAGYPLLLMFGEEFTDGYIIMVVLGIGFVLRSFVGQAQELLIVLGYQRANIKIALVSIASNIALALIFVPIYGVLGAAISTTITYGLRIVIYRIAAQKLIGINVFPKKSEIAK